jgi:hypothetical protein
VSADLPSTTVEKHQPRPSDALAEPVAHETTNAQAPPAEAIALDEQSVEPVWNRTLERLSGSVARSAAAANKLSLDAQGRLVASFGNEFEFKRCNRPADREQIEAKLAEVCGRPVGLVLTTHNEPAELGPAAPARPTLRELQAAAAAQPFVQRAMELFDADPGKLRFAPAEDQN